ncbi:MAG: hypothetical protein Q7O66_16875 [Dehalococcoidia bacterium]|nr:hypothetical protein [Dehalococcoidia bacterium]
MTSTSTAQPEYCVQCGRELHGATMPIRCLQWGGYAWARLCGECFTIVFLQAQFQCGSLPKSFEEPARISRELWLEEVMEELEKDAKGRE